ncbi:MAG: TMEM175 family protein [Candidatus Nomurabacteria bacterium]|nr:TMEM175 family protein [Candidatus Nomurabacteria bacterium]
MNKARLESFTDAVLAIAMTIMVLQLTPPVDSSFAGLARTGLSLLIYALSFFAIAIYWKNHHTLFASVEKINHRILWLNILLLFVLSLFTFTTAWVDEHWLAIAPEVLYGLVMLAANTIYFLLSCEVYRENKQKPRWARSAFSISLVAVSLLLAPIFPPVVVIACLVSLIPWLFFIKKDER